MSKIYNTRTSFVIDLINGSSLSSKKILDVGFIGDSEANVHYYIANRLKESDSLVGIDIDKAKMTTFLSNPKTKTLQESKKVDYKIMSIFETDFENNYFDYVLLLEVFEHLFTPYSVLSEIHRILRPGGSVVVTYPNPLSLGKLLGFLRQRDLLNPEYLKVFKGAPDHKIFPHPVCFAVYLNQIGFQTKGIEFIKYGYFRFFPFFNTILARFGPTKKLSSYIGIWAVKS